MKMCFTNFLHEISHEMLQTTLNFIVNVFNLEFYQKQSSSWFLSCTIKYVLQDCHNSNFSYLHMEPETSLIFKIKSSLAI